VLFKVLGPLEVELALGDVVTPGGARGRALLAALLVHHGAVVPVHRLAEAVWGETQPESVENAVHVAVARLRRALGPAGACVVTRAPGYLLDLRGARVDADLFEQRCRAARTLMDADPAEAARLLDEALGLWRGPAFGDLADGLAHPAAVRLEQLRRGAAEDRAEALLGAGAVEQALAAAGDLAAAHPLAERPVAVLVRGLAATGRTAEALEAYRRLAGVLREELGLDPSPELRELHARLLREELVAPAPAAGRLPRRPSPLVGRDTELRAVAAALTDAPLVTLTGPGGVGKTRLALELAHAAVAEGRSAWWVDLVPVPPPRVAEAVAAAAGVEIVPGRDPVAALCAALAPSQGLLVLDNAEHVLDPLAELAERIVAAAPALTLLVTSRERLALDQEAVRALPPLPVPVGADPTSPAVRLFLARAGALPELAGGDDHGGVALVAELCRRLDGLPLAIELGAARAVALGLPALAERLADRLDLLGGGRRTADRRHRTLRAVLEWSHELLAPAEAVLFRRLGVFPGGFALAQAEAVCAEDGLRGVLPRAARRGGPGSGRRRPRRRGDRRGGPRPHSPDARLRRRRPTPRSSTSAPGSATPSPTPRSPRARHSPSPRASPPPGEPSSRPGPHHQASHVAQIADEADERAGAAVPGLERCRRLSRSGVRRPGGRRRSVERGTCRSRPGWFMATPLVAADTGHWAGLGRSRPP
jgi:DNA-binding SARP family transcriptional activator